ncbi:MAG: hypothetical protein JW936_11810 [Sedimentisphaerales bacterium]|nr:hypothetical protein [Sedimentisphaerales bacterium]
MKTLLTIVLLAGLTVTAGASQLDLRQVPSDVDWLLHLDLDLLRQSEFGQAIREHLESLGLEARAQEFTDYWGFNPQESVTGITMFGYGRDCEQTVILLHGRFNRQAIEQVIGAKPDHAYSSYRNMGVHSWFSPEACGDGQGHTANGIVFNSTLIVASVSSEQFRAEIDVLTSYKSNMASEGAIGQIGEISQGAILAAAVRNLGDLTSEREIQGIAVESHRHLRRSGVIGENDREDELPRATILRQCDEITFRVSEQDEQLMLEANLLTNDVEAAGNICQVLYGIRAFAILSEDEKPRMAELARSVEFNCQAESIDISMACPWPFAFDFITERWEQLTRQQ